jgi:diadenylate cyclase
MNRLLNLFRWQDILDILILTFVFYRLYFFLKEKRALRMIMALFALLFFYMIAQWIDLPLSVWWLKNLWAVILLFLVVIFQQEIREVLGGFNFSTFFFGRSEMKEPGSKALDKIVEAAFQMVDKGIGGLIVLQRRDDLEELIHGKILLDARINEDMLISIFVPQSPLHDGAVIIEGDRIRYATALLPVSNSASLPREWGTRHRAGVGIAEVSDAE